MNETKIEMRSLVMDIISLTYKVGAISATPSYTGEELDEARNIALESINKLLQKIDNL